MSDGTMDQESHIRKIRKGRVEVRLNEDGTVDEMIVYEPNSDKVVLHLEQMEEHAYWLRVQNTDGELDLVLDLVSYRVPREEPVSRFRGDGTIMEPDTEIRATHDWD